MSHKVNSESFPGFFQSHKLCFFIKLSQQESKCNNDLLMSSVIPHQLQQYNRVTNALWPFPKLTRLCSFEAQDLAVLRKYLIELKLFCLLKIFLEVAQNSPIIPRFSRFVVILCNLSKCCSLNSSSLSELSVLAAVEIARVKVWMNKSAMILSAFKTD